MHTFCQRLTCRTLTPQSVILPRIQIIPGRWGQGGSMLGKREEQKLDCDVVLQRPQLTLDGALKPRGGPSELSCSGVKEPGSHRLICIQIQVLGHPFLRAILREGQQVRLDVSFLPEGHLGSPALFPPRNVHYLFPPVTKLALQQENMLLCCTKLL